MIAMFNLWPYVGQVLLLAVLLTVMLGRFIKDGKVRIGTILAILVLSVILPIYGLSISQWLRSVVGDISIFTLIILLNILAQRLLNRSLLHYEVKNKMCVAIAIVGVVFYPLALGVSAFDPYQWGYSPLLMPTLMGLISIYAWFRIAHDFSIILLLPLLAYNFHMLESSNLWDYILDPILFVYAVVQLISSGKARWLRNDASVV